MKVKGLMKYLQKFDPEEDVHVGVTNWDRGTSTVYPVAACTTIPGNSPCLYVMIREPKVIERETDMWDPKAILDEVLEQEREEREGPGEEEGE